MASFLQPEIHLIADENRLTELCAHLSHIGEFAFDTEYDSFKRSYGFNLLLMQIWDGERVYVIDPLAISDLAPLKAVMENRSITKLVYSGSEDIALMKQFDIHIKNVFDVQVAATLCNHPARNLGNLILEEFQLTIDKKLQKSDWSLRPLSDAQLLYVANDVLFLGELKRRLLPEVDRRGLTHVLDEENLALEEVGIREHVPELSTFYYKTYSKSFCEALLALLILRDELAKQINCPPDWIISKDNLEKVLSAQEVLRNPSAWNSFHPRVRSHEGWKKKFVAIISEYDPTDQRKMKSPHYVKFESTRPIMSREEKENAVRLQYDPVFEEYVEKYGELTGEYLLRNLKRIIKGEFKSEEPSRKYQLPIMDKMRSKPLTSH